MACGQVIRFWFVFMSLPSVDKYGISGDKLADMGITTILPTDFILQFVLPRGTTTICCGA